MAKDFVSFPDLNSGLGGIDLLADAARKTLGEDASSNKTLFKALVLRAVSGQELSETTMANVQGADEVKGNGTRSTGTRAYFVKILEDSPHRYLPDACPDGTPGVANIGNNHLIQSMYTYAIDKSGGSLSPNTVVLVRLERKDFGYDTDTGTIEGVIGARESEKIIREAELGCGSPMKAHKDPKKKKKTLTTPNSDPAYRGVQFPNNNIYTILLNDAETLESYQYISSSAPVSPKLKGIVETELDFWSDKIETDESAKPRLKLYWDNLDVKEWTAKDTAWSAAFISYVVMKSDRTFPGSYAHWLYSESVKDSEGPWTLWKTRENKITAQVGDVLVKARRGSKAPNPPVNTATHGDVVYKIENNKAYLAGGNLGGGVSGKQTAKIATTLSLTKEGYYQSYGQYEIVLKKNGQIYNETDKPSATVATAETESFFESFLDFFTS